MEYDILKGLKFEDLITIAVQKKCEIEISLEPTEARIAMRPWKPFEYTCPKVSTSQTSNLTNLDAIRDLDADEVAAYMYGVDGNVKLSKHCIERCEDDCISDCQKCLADWLKQKAVIE